MVDENVPGSAYQPWSPEQVRTPELRGSSRCQRRSLRVVGKEDSMPVWAWVLIIVLVVLLLTGGVYVRR